MEKRGLPVAGRPLEFGKMTARIALAVFMLGILSVAAVGGIDRALAETNDYPPNQRPMYGGIEKTPAMKAADEAYIKSVLAAGYTRAGASKEASKLGFQYLEKDDAASAMKRFNQAWLLDPANGEAYHGFALVLLGRDGNEHGGEAMFRKALSYPSALAGTNADYGRYLILKQRYAEAVPVLDAGIVKDGSYGVVRALLAVALYHKGDAARACREVRQVKGERFNEELTAWVRQVALAKECR
jgi:tetratricopeptide (TPR) repeat protein